VKKKVAKKKATPGSKAVKKKAAPLRKAVKKKTAKKKAAKKKRLKSQPSQKSQEQKTAPETSNSSGQDLGQADGSAPDSVDDISQHDDPYHHDYEHDDHDSYHAHHDEHYHHGHEEHQDTDHTEPALSAPLPVPRSGGPDGDDTMPELDENGEEFGGPVKSFLEHMEDLRWVLIRCVAALGVAMVACLAGAPLLVDTLARPLGEAKQILTENRMETLSEEGKSEIHVRLTQEDVFRIPVETNLLNEAYKLLDLTNEVNAFNLIPAVEDGKLQLLLQPSTKTQAAGRESTQAGPELKSMGPLSGFLVALQMAFYGGIMISLPFILFFLGQFTFPALRRKEKKYLVTAVIIGGGLFFCGAAFCYFLLMEIALSTAALFANWLNFGADIWRAEDYITFVCKFMIGMGIAFELPVVILLLVKIGVLDYKKLSKFRMYWVIINLILASILTPPDIVTQMLMALPMQIFYECSIFIAWIWHRRDRKKEAQLAKEEAEANKTSTEEPEK
jgi:sec-independent protein translocase protein TatC